jgi:hypothetical protein
MGETGVFVFQRYCELGASKWIEAASSSGTAIIYVGHSQPSPRVDGLRLRPHKTRPVYVKKQKLKSSLVQKKNCFSKVWQGGIFRVSNTYR